MPFLGTKKINFTPFLGAKKVRIFPIYGTKKINLRIFASEKQPNTA